MRREHDVFVGELSALHFADHVEDRHLTKWLRLDGQFDDRALPVLREPVQQPVVLTGNVENGRAVGIRREDLLHAPAL